MPCVQELLNSLPSSGIVTPSRTDPAGRPPPLPPLPAGKQAADRVLILPAPSKQFSAGPSPWCDFSCHCLSGQLPQSLSCKQKAWIKEIFTENANWILAMLPRDTQGAPWGCFKTPQPHSRGGEHCVQPGIGDAWAAGLKCSPVERVTCPVNHSEAFTGQFQDHPGSADPKLEGNTMVILFILGLQAEPWQTRPVGNIC